MIDWKAEPTYAGFYVAKAKGLYRDRGLDVTVVEGSGATVSAQLIGTDTKYTIGSCSGAATAIARSRGLPVKSLAVYYHEVPTVVFSLSKNPIRSPADLRGKRIGLTDGSITIDEFHALLTANDLPRTALQEVSVGWEITPLLTGDVDGLLNYAELTPIELKIQGRDVETMALAEHGVHAYSLNLIANDQTIKTDPDLVTRLVEASNAGFRFVAEQPDEAARIFGELFPERDHRFLQESMRQVARQLTQREVGTQTREGWDETLATLRQMGLLKGEVSVDDVALISAARTK